MKSSLLTVIFAVTCINSATGFFKSIPSSGKPHRSETHLKDVSTEMTRKEKKYIVVTGGVISGIGKGVTASSIGVILKMLNLRPTAIKIDPYLNVDAGTMSPGEHGEVFVLDDGSETDLDLGNYERFLDVKLTNGSNLTTGKIYQDIIRRERAGEYLGKTVQIIPHVTDEIIRRIRELSRIPVSDDCSEEEPDVCVIELGGTIGDLESGHFVEALRQLQLLVKKENFCLIHVSMVPMMGDSQEQKTKPTQHSVKELRSAGFSPDFIVCRAKKPIEQGSKNKISLFCNVEQENVLSIPDVSNIYRVPMVLLEQNFHNLLSKKLNLNVIQEEKRRKLDNVDDIQNKNEDEKIVENVELVIDDRLVKSWGDMVERIDIATDVVSIALIGKYTYQQDSYLSVISALKHSCIATDQKLNLIMIESSSLEEDSRIKDPESFEAAWKSLRAADGILVPGGFGVRGIEGKVSAIRYARESLVPFLGICLGMQAAVIEYTRTFLGKPQANSREFEPHSEGDDAAIIFMPEGSKDQMGGTMRLGARSTVLKPDTIASRLYGGESSVSERHRHRYEVNPLLVDRLEEKGLIFSGKDVTKERMEIVELSSDVHPYFLAVQFHPEFQSRPQRPSPSFLGFLTAIKKGKKSANE